MQAWQCKVRRTWKVLWGCLLGAVMGSPAFAQDTVRVEAGPACDDCIQAQPRTQSGHPDDPWPFAGAGPWLGVASDGTVWLSDVQARQELARFDSAGRFQGVRGGAGDAPGEFRRIEFVALSPHDSIYVFDSGTGRASILDPDGQYARSFRIPSPLESFDGGVLPDGRVLVNTSRWGPEAPAPPLRLLGADGEDGCGFGGDPSEHHEDAVGFEAPRRIAVEPGADRVASTTPYRYELELWPFCADAPDLVVEGQVEGFVPRTGHEEQLRRREAARDEDVDFQEKGTIHGLHFADEGHLWMLIVVSEDTREDGEPVLGDGQGPEGQDTVIHVLDPDSWTLVARGRVDAALEFTSEGVALERIHDEQLGFQFVRVWDLTLDL